MRYPNRRQPTMRFMTAKRQGICSETGKCIEAGQEIVYDPASKQAFHENSLTAQNLRGQQFAQAWNMPDADY